MSKFLETFKERGFFHQCTDEEALSKLEGITAYIGFDCTADSLHVGSLMQIMVLRLLKQTGNKPIILLGGATTKVGDPSGKDESRPVITEEEIEKNKAGIKKVFDKFGLGDCKFVDNTNWLNNLNYLDFLRLFGKHFSVNRMINRESVKRRLNREAHLSFLELNYMVLQAFDFVKLAENENCNLQIGGSDQWGNIVEGIDLFSRLKLANEILLPSANNSLTEVKRIIELKDALLKRQGYLLDDMEKTLSSEGLSSEREFDNLSVEYEKLGTLYKDYDKISKKILKKTDRLIEEIDKVDKFKRPERRLKKNDRIFGLTTPLITTSSGAKMGKTADGAVWLDEEKVSAYDYYQFWRNTEDSDVIRFLKFFTELPLKEIEALQKLEGTADINEAKKVLAYEATKLCHGEENAKKAQDAAITAFEQGGTEGLPEVEVDAGELKAFEVFVVSGLASSNGEARRLIKGGGAKIDDVKLDDDNSVVKISDGMKISSGKKKHIILKVK